MCFCSLFYPACTDHVPYCAAICSLSRFTIFFVHYFTDGTFFGKKIYSKKMCVLFTSKKFGDAFRLLRRNQRDITINAQTAVAVFRKQITTSLCFSIDLDLNFLFSWLLVLLSFTFFLDLLFSFFPVLSNP